MKEEIAKSRSACSFFFVEIEHRGHFGRPFKLMLLDDPSSSNVTVVSFKDKTPQILGKY